MIHLVGLPHTSLDKEKYSHCAFTAKAARLVEMLEMLGREVTVYWGDKMMGAEWQGHYFPPYGPGDLPPVAWDVHAPYWDEFHTECIARIQAEIEPHDVVAIVAGEEQQAVVDAFNGSHIVVEVGAGYQGICVSPNTYACFESYAWMHNRYGAKGIVDGRAFDTVIPNAVDPADWELGSNEGYALFVGRCVARKGPHVAAEIARAAGLPLVIAGGGILRVENFTGSKEQVIVCADGTRIVGNHVTYVGGIAGETRRNLFARAAVMLCPTLYIGPWEGVHAEAMMSGVPVVAPDYGVFTETVPWDHRYSTFREAVTAVNMAERGEHWRTRAIDMFGIDVCARRYDQWFDRLDTLWARGWYA